MSRQRACCPSFAEPVSPFDVGMNLAYCQLAHMVDRSVSSLQSIDSSSISIYTSIMNVSEDSEPSISKRELIADESGSSSDQQQYDGETSEERAARLIESKRAYNRMISARARKRSKDLVSDLTRQLQAQVNSQQELQKRNAELQTRVSFLEGENQLLRNIIGNDSVQGHLKHANMNGGSIDKISSPPLLQAKSETHTPTQTIESLLTMQRGPESQLAQQQMEQLQKQYNQQQQQQQQQQQSRQNVSGGSENLATLLHLLQQQQQDEQAPTNSNASYSQQQLASLMPNNFAAHLYASQLLGNPPQQLVTKPMQQQDLQQAALISSLLEKMQQQQQQQNVNPQNAHSQQQQQPQDQV
ncbi:hypothetical protein MPSEU_001077900 [Mayamaea pseudoterrestris]|nr:hypothetical protein MPSEU_001077900 [Mayamaea pseudoterrestris]